MYLRKALGVAVSFGIIASMAGAQTTAPAAQGSKPTAPSATLSTPQAAAGTTRVHGTVADPDGAIIPGASITLTSAKGASINVKSGGDGSYSVQVAPGTYTLLVTMPGFAAYSVTNLKVPNIPSTTVDAKLKIGEQTQVVNVDANAIQLSVDPDNNADSTVISGKALEALSDDPDELESELTALAGPSAGPNGGQIYVDGFTGGQLPPKSSIREIRINQNPFSAQYDKLGYGRVEVFTKPGTDKLHGNMQFNYNPSQFNDSNPLSPVAEPSYHTLFFFGNLTGPLNKSASYNLGGSFRQIQDDSFTNATVYGTGTGLSPTICSPGALGCSPLTYQAETYYPQIRGDFNPRLDLALGSKNVLTIRYQFVDNTSKNAGVGALILPTVGVNSSSMSNILQVSDTENISTRFINENRFEYEREHTASDAILDAMGIISSGNFTGGGSSAGHNSDHQDHIEYQNYSSLQLKKNFIRFGGRLRTTREAVNPSTNTNGQFTYTTLTYTCPTGGFEPGTTIPCVNSTTGQGTAVDHSYATGSPNQFGYTLVNNHDIHTTYADVGIYAEDDWKPTSNLTVSYGIRYEAQNHIADHADWAPRVAVTYGIGPKNGAPKVVVHGGFGLFYDRFAESAIMTTVEQNGSNETVYVVSNPGAACAPVYGAKLTPALIANCNATAQTQTTYQIAQNFRTPYIQQAAVGADYGIGKIGKISLNYIHSQGAHALATQNLPATPGYVANPANGVVTGGPIYQYFTEGVYTQNQMFLSGQLSIAKWVQMFGFYMLNSANGDTSGSAITTPGNMRADYGRTTFAVKQRGVIGGSITLPHYFGVSPFMLTQSGNPYNISTGSDNNGDTFFNDRPLLANNLASVAAQYAASGNAASAPVKTIAGCGTFAQPGTANAGTTTVPINYCTGPALFSLNLRVTKTWGFGGSRNGQNSNQGGRQRDNSQNGPPPTGGGPGGGGSHGGGGGGGSRGGGPGGPAGGGGASTGQKYNFSIGAQAMNLFGNKDLSTPQGALSSTNFGQSTQLSGGPYTGASALRRLSVQASFTF